MPKNKEKEKYKGVDMGVLKFEMFEMNLFS